MVEASGGGFFSNLAWMFGGVGKFFLTCLTDSKWRNGIIISLMILGFLYTPFKMSLSEGSPRYVVDKLVTSIASGDNGINIEVEKAKNLDAIGKFSLFQMLLSLTRILGLFYFSYYLIGFIVWKIVDNQDQTSPAKNFTITVLLMVIFQIAGSVYIIFQDHDGDLREDFHFIVGEKSLMDMILFLNPIKGVINLITSYDMYLEPFARIGERLLH